MLFLHVMLSPQRNDVRLLSLYLFWGRYFETSSHRLFSKLFSICMTISTFSSNLPNYTTKEYKGICYTVFKDRYGNHNKLFNNERYKTDTELSKEVWAVKDKNGPPKISWSIFGRFPPYNPESKRCIRKTIY